MSGRPQLLPSSTHGAYETMYTPSGSRVRQARVKSQGSPPRRPGLQPGSRPWHRSSSGCRHAARPGWARAATGPVTSGAHGPRPARAASQAMTAAPSPTGWRGRRPPGAGRGRGLGRRPRRAPRPAHRCPRRWPPTRRRTPGRPTTRRVAPTTTGPTMARRSSGFVTGSGRRTMAAASRPVSSSISSRKIQLRAGSSTGAGRTAMAPSTRRQGDHAQQRHDAPQAGAQQHEQHEATDGIEGHPLGGQRQTECDAGARQEGDGGPRTPGPQVQRREEQRRQDQEGGHVDVVHADARVGEEHALGNDQDRGQHGDASPGEEDARQQVEQAGHEGAHEHARQPPAEGVAVDADPGQAPVRRHGQELAAVAVGVLRLRVGEQDARLRRAAARPRTRRCRAARRRRPWVRPSGHHRGRGPGWPARSRPPGGPRPASSARPAGPGPPSSSATISRRSPAAA